MYSALQGMLVLIIFMEIMLFSQAIRKQFLGICIEIPSRVDFIHELMKLTCDIVF